MNREQKLELLTRELAKLSITVKELRKTTPILFDALMKEIYKGEKTPEQRLKKIAEIIEEVDNRCIQADGPVTPTLQEMTQKEISMIYKLARSKKQKNGDVNHE